MAGGDSLLIFVNCLLFESVKLFLELGHGFAPLAFAPAFVCLLLGSFWDEVVVPICTFFSLESAL